MHLLSTQPTTYLGDPGEAPLQGILTPLDEVTFWAEQASAPGAAPGAGNAIAQVGHDCMGALVAGTSWAHRLANGRLHSMSREGHRGLGLLNDMLGSI
jgi:hypothetical protein